MGRIRKHQVAITLAGTELGIGRVGACRAEEAADACWNRGRSERRDPESGAKGWFPLSCRLGPTEDAMGVQARVSGTAQSAGVKYLHISFY